ncbi:acyltransferase family protein [Algoriphagus limi]|uniref:Acyltransferase n=1 Tax=Algoriphagus limi TaxID=2975273 RepID=A0ABT2G170_9BACT|nr:acyltransferase [Algoriphagus limi]MCS5489020.1 acyltransferase [Algoriphagus limi]
MNGDLRLEKLGYIPELDGLRALAVFLVMIAHSNIYFGSNGGIGVDIFFALSGFLITTLIFEEKDRYGKFNFKFFYARRFFRLFPALFFFLIVSLVLVLLFFKESWDIFIEEFVVSFFYLYNISWYWGVATEPFMLFHMWSLGVEEQFYIWWPLIIVFLTQIVKSKAIFQFLLFLSFLIFLFSFYLQKYLFFNSIFMDSIFFGSILGLLRRNYSLKFIENNLVMFISLMLLFTFSIIDFDFISKLIKSGYRGIFGFLTCLVIINFVSKGQESSIKRLFRSKIFTFFGKLSYSLYLWHVVVFVCFREIKIFEPFLNYLLKFFVSFIISFFSYFLIEKKILRFSNSKYSVLIK